MAKATVVARVQFNPKLKIYEFTGILFALMATIVGIPLIPLWLIFGRRWAQRHFDALSATLTEKALCVKKGVWFRSEKTIPLEKITDLALSEGPILRYFGLCNLKVETAGQSQPGSANADMTGVIDALGFRDRVLAQRDLLEDRKLGGAPALAPPPPDSGSTAILTEIRDSLQRIEKRIATATEERDGDR